MADPGFVGTPGFIGTTLPVATAAANTFASNVTPTVRTAEPAVGGNCYLTAGKSVLMVSFFGGKAANAPSQVSVHGWAKNASSIWYPQVLGSACLVLGTVAGLTAQAPTDTEYWASEISVISGGHSRRSADGSPAVWFVPTDGKTRVSIYVTTLGSTSLGWVSSFR